MSSTTGTRPAPGRPREATVTPLRSKLQNPPLLWRPLASYYLLLASTAVLIGFGVVMVWSSSYVASNKVSFAVVQKQLLWIGIGLPVMLIATRLPVKVFRFLAYPAMLGAGALLVAVLVPGLGHSANGATRWVALGGPFTVQPSEFAKLGLVLWGADLLARKHRLKTLDSYRRIMIPLLPVTLVVLALIEKEHDLGTLLVVLTIVLSLLWVIGAPMRLFGFLVSVVIAGVTYLAISQPYRLQRLVNFGNPFKDLHNTGWQAGQGIYALGAGGWFGVGLGGSRQKWGYLPEAHTDFIFAIIGEELGLVGTLAVLILFAVLAYAGIRVAQRSRDMFSRLAASAIVAWLLVQALVNIGAVIGVLPITGIPLPLISAGGSALLPTMFALGMLMSLARREPSAAAALAARGPNALRRGLSRTASMLHLTRRGR
ncbi:MAG: cell division protein FtsW [Actinomycetota bacterium]|nr:cell division protein FtsW [Actinomycetota bacterium]